MYSKTIYSENFTKKTIIVTMKITTFLRLDCNHDLWLSFVHLYTDNFFFSEKTSVLINETFYLYSKVNITIVVVVIEEYSST